MRSWSWRRVGALLVALPLLASIHTQPARSQEAESDAGPAAEVGAVAPAAASVPLVERLAWLEHTLTAELAARAGALGGARIGVAVVDLATGQLLYGHDPDGGYNVASNTKLVTAAAALALLGPEFTYHTGLYAEARDPDGSVPGELYLRAQGDPTLGTAELADLAHQLALAGVSKIRGGLVIDDGYFDQEILPPHYAEQPKEQAYFRAAVSSAGLNFNAVRIEVRPAPTGAGPAAIAVEPASDYVVIDAQVDTVGSGRSRLRVDTKVERDKLTLILRGQLRADAPPQIFRRRIPDPTAYLGATLARLLTREGVVLGRKRVTSGKLPLRTLPLALHDSPPLAVIVRDLGKHSNNFVAETLLKTIGAESRVDRSQPATWQDGLAAVDRFLTTEVGWKPGSYTYGNGSGLFQASKMSPRQLTLVLAAAARDYRWGPDYVAQLSIAAADGTLAHRMLVGPAARRVRGKTGTLETVSALAGFAADDGRRPLAFAVLINDVPHGGGHAARALEDAIATRLVEYAASAPGR